MNNSKDIDTAVNSHSDPHLKKEKRINTMLCLFLAGCIFYPKHSRGHGLHANIHTLTECSDGIMTECFSYMGGAVANSRGGIAAASVACICENLSAFAWVYTRTPAMHTNVRAQNVCFFAATLSSSL